MRERMADVFQRIRTFAFQCWEQVKALSIRLWNNRPSWKKCLQYSLFTLGLLLLVSLIFILSVYLGAFSPLPDYSSLKNIRNDNASELYSEDGVLLGRYFIENRVNADFEEINPVVIDALIAIEDARFFEHGGVDIRALGRVFLRTFLLRDASGGGGSTLSQQLAKNLFGREDYGLFTIPVNKVRELFTARRLERVYTKEDLLRLYLNTVPFGENTFGIKTAAQRFFDKSPADLKVEEAAVLVGMLKATTYYNPVRNHDRALGRRNTVIQQMTRYKYLLPAEADSLQQLPLEVQYHPLGELDGLAVYFREHLRPQIEDALEGLKKEDGSGYNLYTDGLRIFTSIDARLQRWAETAVSEQMQENQTRFNKEWEGREPWGGKKGLERLLSQTHHYRQLKANGLEGKALQQALETPRRITVFDWEQGEKEVEWSTVDSVKFYASLLRSGLLSVEPQTGLIKAWVGGIDYRFLKYDHVKARRQVGSTFKPVVYAQALRTGVKACDYYPNRLTAYPEYENWEPRNSDGEYGGVYSVIGALSNSVNTITVDLIMSTGVEPVRQLAKDMGFSSEIPKGPAIALGALDGSLLDMCRVYSTIANNGRRPTFHALDRIETSEGDVLVEFERPKPYSFEPVLDKETALLTRRMLEMVVDSGTARRLHYEFGLYTGVAGKTGTTQNQSDGWFVGITPKLVTAVWVGAEVPSIHFRTMSGGQGSSTALPIFGNYMRKVKKDERLRHYRPGQFEPLADTLAYLVECPHYLDFPMLSEDLWVKYDENPEFFQRLFNELGGNPELPIDIKRRRNNETDEEYFERMRRYNERLQDRERNREELKSFWSKLLFPDKSKEEGGM